MHKSILFSVFLINKNNKKVILFFSLLIIIFRIWVRTWTYSTNYNHICIMYLVFGFKNIICFVSQNIWYCRLRKLFCKYKVHSLCVIFTIKISQEALQSSNQAEASVSLSYDIVIGSLMVGCWGLWKLRSKVYNIYNFYNLYLKILKRKESAKLSQENKPETKITKVDSMVDVIINLESKFIDEGVVAEKAARFQQDFKGPESEIQCLPSTQEK